MSAVRAYLEMIKVEHSVFALPFALVGMMYAADGFPGWRTFLLILFAMVSARSAAMAFNRLVDAKIDAENPRTKERALPAGLLSGATAWTLFSASAVVFLASAGLLNPLTLALAPAALAVLLGYSYTKRFTSLCHLFVGLSLGLAPAGAWIAVTGEFSWTPVYWLLGVTLWTAGFDILYALQDEQFDRRYGLKSLVVSFGASGAIWISRAFHVFAIVFMLFAGTEVGAGLPYYAGCGFAGVLLFYEQSLVRPNDLSKLNMAFFTLNGYVAAGFFFFALLDVLTRGGS